jgi:hypothetical protein
MDQPILEALTETDVAEALRDYVMRRHGVRANGNQPGVNVSYKMSGNRIAAVAVYLDYRAGDAVPPPIPPVTVK